MTRRWVLCVVLIFVASLVSLNLHAQQIRGQKLIISGSDGGAFGVDDGLIIYQEGDKLASTKIYDDNAARAGFRDPITFRAEVGDTLTFSIHDTWGSCAGLDPIYLSCAKKKEFKPIGGGWYRSCVMPGGDQGIAHTFTYTIKPEDSCAPLKIDGVEISQAIQSYQPLEEMRSSGPRVPIVADKPAVVRVYFTEVTSAEQVTLSIAGDLSESRTIDVQPGCSPEKQRAGQNGCASADFYFTPGRGTVTLTLTLTMSDGETKDEEISFPTVRTRSVNLRSLSLCTYEPTPGTWACGAASALSGKLDLLTRILPAPSLSASVTPTVIRNNVNDGSLFSTIEAWASQTGSQIEALYGSYNRFTDNLLLERTTYIAMADPEPTSGGDPLGGIGGAATDIPAHSAWARSSALRFNSNIESSGEITAHEIAHTLGLHHTNTDVPTAGDPPGCYDQAALGQGESSGWSFPDNYLQDSKGKQWGFDVTNRTPIDPSNHFDVSSYCSPRWISPDTYTILVNTLRTASPAPNAQRSLPNAMGTPVVRPRAVTTAQRFWRITGRISGNAATFDPIFILDLVGDTEAGTGDYTLAVDGSSGRLFERHLKPAYTATETKSGDLHSTTGTFTETIPFSPDATSITLYGSNLAQLGRIALDAGTGPTVTVTPPADTTHATALNWNVSGTTTGRASLVQYSSDGGTNWVELGTTRGSQYQMPIDFTMLAGGTDSLLRVYVTDGIHTGSATTTAFSVPRKDIGTIHITSPQNGLKLPEGQPFYISGSAWDPEDGVLADSQLTWDLDGTTSTANNSFVKPNLSPGPHTITLTAHDSDGNTRSTSVQILAGAAPPSVIFSTGYDLSSCPYVTINVTSPWGTLASVQQSTDAGAHYTDLDLTQLPVNFAAKKGGFTTLVVRATDTVGQTTTRSIDFVANSSCAGATTPSIRIDGVETRSTLIGTPFETPLAVYVTDSNGAPLTGVPLSIAVPGSGASATFPSSLIATDSRGYAYVPARANSIAGSYALKISAYRYPTVSASFQLTNTAPVASSILINSGNSQVARRNEAFSSPLSVLIYGTSGIAVGTPVSFSQPADGRLVLSSSTAVTDANGKASINVTAGDQTGSFNIAVTSAQVTNPAIFTLTVSNPRNVITAISGSGQKATVNQEFAEPLIVKVTRASDGSPVPNLTLTTAPPATGPRAYLIASSFFVSTDDQGIATLPMRANESAGNYTMIVKEADSNGINSTSASFDLTNIGTNNLSIEATGGDGQTAATGSEFTTPLTVLVKDKDGAPKAGALLTFTAPTSGAALSTPSIKAITGADGTATLTARANDVEGSYQVAAAVQGGVDSAIFHLSNGTNSPLELLATDGGGQAARVSTAFAKALSVRLTEKTTGTPRAGVAVSFSAPAAGASAQLSASTATTDANGDASVTAIANASAGNYAITASANGALAPAIFSLTNTAAGASMLSLALGDQQTTHTMTAYPVALAVMVKDASGNPQSGVAVSFLAPTSGASASLSASSATTGSDGIASVLATANTVAGSFTIVASSPAASGTATFRLTNQAADRITMSSGSGQATPLNSSFDMVLQVKAIDGTGAANPGVTVRFRAPASGASATLSPENVVTGADGLATTRVSANSLAGSYSVVASSEGLEGTASFSLTNEGPASLSVREGDPQGTVVGSGFATALSARVMTASGKPVPGIQVTFATATTGAAAVLASITASTDADGIASTRASANNMAGVHTVIASVTGLAGSATFHLSNTDFTLSGPPSAITLQRGSSTTATYTIASQAGFSGAVTLACSTPISGLNCSFSPNTASVSGNSTTATLTVAADNAIRPAGFSLAAVLLLFLVLWGQRHRSVPRLLLLILAATAAGSISGCGSSNSTSQQVNSTITVTATSGQLVRTTTVTITVK